MLRAQTDGMRLRIGVHQGEVVPEGDDLMGDGVIVASRLEPLAEPGSICISSRVREDASGKMALEVDDLGEPPLKNITARIRVFRVRLSAAERASLPLPDKPSLVVLPFQNMSGEPEQEYFTDGMVEDITTALSRIRSLFVIARNSAYTYKGRAVDVRQVGRELGVHYVLEGSVRKAGSRVRITGEPSPSPERKRPASARRCVTFFMDHGWLTWTPPRTPRSQSTTKTIKTKARTPPRPDPP